MDLVKFALYPLLAAVPVVVVAALFRRFRRQELHDWLAFKRQLRRLGLVMAPDTEPSVLDARGKVAGLPVSVERFVPELDDNERSLRLRIRIGAPSGLRRAGVYRPDEVDRAKLGAMKEVHFEPEFDPIFRTYAARPEELGLWLSSETRRALMALPELICVEIEEGGQLSMVVRDRAPAAQRLADLIDVLIALHERRAPRETFRDGGWETPWQYGWLLTAILPLIVAFLFTIFTPLIPGVPSLLTPIVCDQGELKMVWRGDSSQLRCVHEGRQELGAQQCVLPGLLLFNLFHLPLTAAMALHTWRRLRRRDELVHHRESQGGPYR